MDNIGALKEATYLFLEARGLCKRGPSLAVGSRVSSLFLEAWGLCKHGLSLAVRSRVSSLFLEARGLCKHGLSLAVGGRVSSLVAVRGLLTVVAPLVEHRFQTCWAAVTAACGLNSFSSRSLEHGISSHAAQAWLPRGMRNFPGPGIEPEFLPIGPRRKSPCMLLNYSFFFFWVYAQE